MTRLELDRIGAAKLIDTETAAVMSRTRGTESFTYLSMDGLVRERDNRANALQRLVEDIEQLTGDERTNAEREAAGWRRALQAAEDEIERREAIAGEERGPVIGDDTPATEEPASELDETSESNEPNGAEKRRVAHADLFKYMVKAGEVKVYQFVRVHGSDHHPLSNEGVFGRTAFMDYRNPQRAYLVGDESRAEMERAIVSEALRLKMLPADWPYSDVPS